MWHDLGIDYFAPKLFGDCLHDAWSGYWNRYQPLCTITKRQLSHRRQQFSSVKQLTMIIDYINALTAGINSDAKIGLKSRRDGGQYLHVSIEFFGGTRVTRWIS